MSQGQNHICSDRLTRKGVVVWCALILFVMAWMFVLGILVGRGTAPLPARTQTLEKELVELKTAMLTDNEGEKDNTPSSREPQAAELGFHEALKKPPVQPAPVEPSKRRPPAAQAPAARPPAAAPATVQYPPVARTVTPPKDRQTAPVQAEAVPPDKTDARRAAAAPPDAQGGRYTIQIAAFRDDQGAEKMVQDLRAKGYPAYFLHSEVPGKGFWYRVRVGAFQDRTAAEGMLKRLNGDRFHGMVVGTP